MGIFGRSLSTMQIYKRAICCTDLSGLSLHLGGGWMDVKNGWIDREATKDGGHRGWQGSVCCLPWACGEAQRKSIIMSAPAIGIPPRRQDGRQGHQGPSVPLVQRILWIHSLAINLYSFHFKNNNAKPAKIKDTNSRKLCCSDNFLKTSYERTEYLY